jgi:glycosyl transferase family 87
MMTLEQEPKRAGGEPTILQSDASRGEGRQGPPLLPWLVLLFLGGAVLGASVLIGPALGGGPYYRSVLNRMTYGYNRQVMLLFVPYGLALLAWWRGSRISVRILLGGAVFLHLLMLFAPLPQSQDFYQYLFYGRMQSAYGANPYAVQPVAFWLDGWYGLIRWPTQTSVYGPLWSMLSFGVARAAGSNLTAAIVLMKTAIFAMDLSIMWSILALSKDRRDPEHAAGWGLLVYAWNPLILITVPLGGLVDVGVAAAILGAMVARRRGRTWLVTVLLVAATLIKVYAGIALVLYLVLLLRERGRREARRHTLAAFGLGALAFAPYWAGWQTFRGLLNIVDQSNKSLTGTVQKVLAQLFRLIGVQAALNDAAALVRWVVFGALVLTVLWAIRKVETEHDLWYGTLVVLSVYVLLTPWYLYWYLVAPLALVAVLPRNRFTFPVLAFTGTTLITARFPPWLLAQVVQTSLRYMPSIALYRREITQDRKRRGRLRRTLEATEPLRVRASAAESGRFVHLV